VLLRTQTANTCRLRGKQSGLRLMYYSDGSVSLAAARAAAGTKSFQERLFMNSIRLGLVTTAACALAGFSGASLADGKATFDGICGECHEAADFEGEDVAELSGIINEIVSGELKHKKKLTLSEQEITDIATFLASGGQ
jgi:mono/diheme cytochrome c family protein